MILTFTQSFGYGLQFFPNAFDNMIGKEISVTMPDGKLGKGIIIKVEVVNDGSTLDITLELDEDTTTMWQKRGFSK